MFSWIRRRATYANVAMTLALVFAMSGGAYAAKKYLVTSTKQISPSVLKQLTGKAGKAGVNGKDGAPGAAGPQGPAGTNGKDGVNGANGKDGAPGTAGATGPQGPAGAKGANGTNGATGPQGPVGPAGEINTEGPLPEGKTETGAWAVGAVQLPKTKGVRFKAARTVASFPIPLEKALTESQIHAVNSNGEEFVEFKFAPATVCLGSVAAPTAPSGNLCVYFNVTSYPNTFAPIPLIEKLTSPNTAGELQGASTTGALINVATAEEEGENEEELVTGGGSWAVTG